MTRPRPVTRLKAACMDCGLDYSKLGLDTTLPRSQWLEIHPADGGVLCANCIVKRCRRKLKGAVAVRAVVEVWQRNRRSRPRRKR